MKLQMTFFAEARKCAEVFTQVMRFNKNELDQVEKHVMVAYLFGMFMMLGSEMEAEGSDIQASLVASLVHILGFSEREATELSTHTLKCTERKDHPAEFTVINRGLEGYVEFYRTGKSEQIPADIKSILDVLREFAVK